MTDLNCFDLNVELLPARTTMAAGILPSLQALGGRGGNGGTSILSGIALGILNQKNVNAAASDGADGGSAANVVSGG